MAKIMEKRELDSSIHTWSGSLEWQFNFFNKRGFEQQKQQLLSFFNEIGIAPQQHQQLLSFLHAFLVWCMAEEVSM